MKTRVLDAILGLDKAVDILRAGELVSFPTETVYGLGANALDERAVEKIFKAKGRPQDNPLIVHVSSVEMLRTLLLPNVIPLIYESVIAAHWPGPLTILVPKPDCIPLIVTAGQGTVAFRIPGNEFARNLIEKCGFPIAAPSANTSGRPSPTLAQHVLDDLNGRINLILDGGPCSSGLESTVLDGLRDIPAILRPGSVTAEMLEKLLGQVDVYRRDFVDSALEAKPTTPGMKYKHYCPNAEVVVVEICRSVELQMEAIDVEIQHCLSKGLKVGVLLTGNQEIIGCATRLCLGNTAKEVAHSLFSHLRQMEKTGVNIIIVQGIAEEGEGLAVMNRIRKAASKVI